MLVTKQLTVAIDFHMKKEKKKWKSVATMYYLVTNILQTTFFYVQQKKEYFKVLIWQMHIHIWCFRLQIKWFTNPYPYNHNQPRKSICQNPLFFPPIVISEILNIFSKKNIPKYILLPQQNAITGAQSRHYDITTRVA